MNPLEEREVVCPWCGEAFGVVLDLTGGSQNYIEDCAVCCQPIEFELSVGDDDASVALRRDNG